MDEKNKRLAIGCLFSTALLVMALAWPEEAAAVFRWATGWVDWAMARW